MKFDPLTWNEVSANETIQIGKGVLRLRASAPVPVYIEIHGVEALADYGTNVEIEVSEAARAKVIAPKGVRVFVYTPLPTAVQAQGEVFTNIDRMPSESGPMAEVTRALRALEIERRAALRDIRQAAATAGIGQKRLKAAHVLDAEPEHVTDETEESEGEA